MGGWCAVFRLFKIARNENFWASANLVFSSSIVPILDCRVYWVSLSLVWSNSMTCFLSATTLSCSWPYAYESESYFSRSEILAKLVLISSCALWRFALNSVFLSLCLVVSSFCSSSVLFNWVIWLPRLSIDSNWVSDYWLNFVWSSLRAWSSWLSLDKFSLSSCTVDYKEAISEALLSLSRVSWSLSFSNSEIECYYVSILDYY